MTTRRDGAGDEIDRDGVAVELDEAWREFQAQLAEYLAAMTDPEERDHLVVELPDPAPQTAGCPPYAQWAAFGDGQMLRAEVSGNAFLTEPFRLDAAGRAAMRAAGWEGGSGTGDGGEEPNWYVDLPVAEAGVAAAMAVSALRCRFGIVHPQLMTYQAWGPAATELATLSLGLLGSDEVPADPYEYDAAVIQADNAASGVIAVETTSREALLQNVGDLLRTRFGVEPEVDDDEDFVVEHLGQPVWVRVREEQPAVEILARVAHDVVSRRRAAVELAILNRDNLWVQWTLRGRAIWQSIIIPARPFAPAHLDGMLDVHLAAMAETRDDLVLRLGARVS